MSKPVSPSIAPGKASADVAQRQPSTLASLISGSVGGASQVLVGQPLDTLKTRAQTAPEGMFKNTWDIASQTVRKEGFFALYKGMASPLLGIAGVNSLLFASNTYARKWVNPLGNLSIAEVATAGAIAGAVQAVLASPVEMFKIRMQGQYGIGGKNLRQVVGGMYNEWGWRKGIMRGYWITVVREIPAYAGFYVGYESTKRSFQAKLGDSLPLWAMLTSGGVGGIGYWTACYPLDVVKSRIQLADKPPQGANYIVNTFAKIYREEGARAFIKGLTPTYLRAVPAAAATFVAFELTMEQLQKNTSL